MEYMKIINDEISGKHAIFNAEIAVDLKDTLTQKQIKDLQEFYEMNPLIEPATNFINFIFHVITQYNRLRNDNNTVHSDEVNKKVVNTPENKVKISLDTAPLDDAIKKADNLIAKLKFAQLLINSFKTQV